MELTQDDLQVLQATNDYILDETLDEIVLLEEE
mgnify:CR=1 FL=1